MRHIRTKLILLMVSIVFITCLCIAVLQAYLVSGIYMGEIYQSSSRTLSQISHNIDTIVKTVENSIELIFFNDNTADLFIKTDYEKPTGDAYATGLILDRQIIYFKKQFKYFDSLIAFLDKGGHFTFQYYNPEILQLKESSWYQKVMENSNISIFEWHGIYNIGNYYTNPAQPRDIEYYVVTCRLNSINNLYPYGTLVILLNKNIFSGIYTDTKNDSGEQIIILDDKFRPVMEYSPEINAKIQKAQENRNNYANEGYYTEENKLINYIKSPVTGWITVKMTPLSHLTQKINRSYFMITIIGIVFLICSGIIIIIWSFRFSRSIIRVADAMAKVRDGNINVRVPFKGQDEISVISQGFNNMAENLGNLLERIVEKERIKKNAEIRAMQYQIKPHFLYNTLASIRILALKENNSLIADQLLTLNRLLRNTINIKDAFITFGDELSNLRDYISIVQNRYNNRFTFIFNIPEDLLIANIPNMILQPIVENCIEHAFTDRIGDISQECRIEIKAWTDKDLYIEIRDNGVGLTGLEIKEILHKTDSETEGRAHIGINNINERLKMLYGEEYSLVIDSVKHQFTSVCFRIGKLI